MKKKFTMLLAALLCCVGVAKAQWGNRPIESVSSTAATELVDGYYVIYNNGRGTFLNAEASLGQAKVTWPTSASYTGTEALNSDEDLTNASGTKNKNAYVFYANVEGTTVSLKNGYGNYVPALTSDGNFNYVSDEAFWSFAFKTDANSSYVFLSNSESGKGLDCNGWGADSHTYSTAAGWNADGSQSVSGNQSWTFYPVVFKSDVTLVDLVINYTFGGNEVKTETVQGLAGSEYTIPALDFTSVASCAIDDAAATEGATIVVPDANATITVELANNLPFAVSADYENAAWYVLQIRGNKYMYKNGDGIKVSTATPTTEDALWAFMGDPFTGITVLNKAAGASYTLANDNGIKMKDGEAFVWNISKGNGGFMLREGTTGNNYIHNVGNGDGIGYWDDAATANDPGSAFVVTSEAEMISLATTAMGLASKLDTYAEASYYTYPNAAVAEAKATLQGVATPTDFLTALNAKATVESVQAALNTAGKSGAPAAGDIIMLKNKNVNKYLIDNGENARIETANKENKALWEIVAGETGVKLKNYATGRYLGSMSQSQATATVEAEIEAGEYTWTNTQDVYAAFNFVGSNQYGHESWSNLVGWWDKDANASQWVVTNVRPLSITYLYNDEQLSTSTEYVEYGTVYTVSSSYDFTKVSACTKNEEALEAVDGVFSFEVTEATTLTVELADDLPFEKTVLNQDGSFPANTAWYVVRQHSSQGYAWTWKYDETNGVTAEPGLTTGYTDNHLWCFAGSKDDIKIYNKVAGKGFSLTNTDPASMAAENAAVWKMVKSAAEATFAGKNPFCLQKGNENLYLNAQTENGINKLKYWTSRDQGSTIMVIAQSAIELEALVNRLNGTIDAMIKNAGNGIGYYESAEDVAKLKNAIDKAQVLLDSNSKKNEDYVAAIAELNELETKAAKIELPEVGKYYRIKGKTSGNYIDAAGQNNAQMNMKATPDPLGSIFLLDEGNRLRNMSTDTYVYETRSIGATKENANTWEFISSSIGYLKLKSNFDSPWLHDSSSKADRCKSDGENHEFIVEEVTLEELNEIYLEDCTYITALDYTENSNNPVIVNNVRSNWAVADKPVALRTLYELGLAKNVADTKQQFAIITPDEGQNYYLYSVHAKRYLKSNNTFSTQGEPIVFADASAQGANKVQVRFKDIADKYINVGGSNQMTIDSWSTIDKGNACEIVQCNTLTFNLDEALNVLNKGAEVTIKYMYDGTEVLSQNELLYVGDTKTIPCTWAYTEIASVTVNGVALDAPAADADWSFAITEVGPKEVIVNLAYNTPFAISASYENAIWYRLRIRPTRDGADNVQWVAKTENTPYPNNTTRPTTDDGLWAFVGNPINGFKVLNKASEDMELGIDNANVIMKSSGTLWTIGECWEGDNLKGFYLYEGTENKYVHDFNGNLQIWNNSSASTDAGSAFVAVAPLTIKYMLDGKELTEHKIEDFVAYGSLYTISNPITTTGDYKAFIASCSSTGSQPVKNGDVWTVNVTEGTTIIITLAYDLPFQYADSYENIQHWYYLNIAANGYYLYHEDGAGYIALDKTAVDVNSKDAYSWAFIGNPTVGFQIVNKAKGEGWILSSSTTMEGTTGSNTWPIMNALEELPNTYNTYWIPTKSSNRTNRNGFYLEQKDYSSNKLNNRGSKLAYWTDGADAGSTLVAVEQYDMIQLPYSGVASWDLSLVYPEGLKNGAASGSHGSAVGHIEVEGHTIYKSTKAIVTTEADVKVSFNYASGNPHGLIILGVDVVNGNGDVVAADYHVGFTGGAQDNKLYTLSGLPAGNYILRYYVCDKNADHELSKTGGNIEVTNAKELTDIDVVSSMWKSLQVKAQSIVAYKGEGLGYYNNTSDVEAKAAVNPENTVADYVVAFVALDDALDCTRLALPEAGKFYRIKNNGGTGYLSSGESGRTQFKAGIENDASSIFGYIDGKLLSYKNGMYIHNDGGQLKYADNPGDGIAINFVSSLEPGKLQIHYYTTENRYLYSGGTGNTDAGRDAANTTEARYRFTVEEVTTLPVTVASIGYATLFAPVALQIPDGVNVYVGKIDEDCLILTPINGNVIPANTGVLIEAALDTYTFPIVADDNTIEANAFTGSYAKSVKNPDKKVYTLQNGKNGVGFYLFKGYKDENDKEGTKTYINGFRSWVELPLSASAQGLRIRKEGTNVEDVELENELFPVIYDLMGRRVEKMDKGIYIVNGKKILVK